MGREAAIDDAAVLTVFGGIHVEQRADDFLGVALREATRGEHQARIPEELVSALRRVAHELGLPLSSVLLTAHAKVLDVLSGEHEMTSGSWRQSLLESARAEPRLQSHKMSVDFLEHDNLVLRLRYRTDAR